MEASSANLPSALETLPLRCGFALSVLFLGIFLVGACSAQEVTPSAASKQPQLASLSTVPLDGAVSTSPDPLADSGLPDAPIPQLATEPKPKRGTDPRQRIARKSTKVIPSDWTAQPLSAGDKIRVGLDGILSPENLAGIVLAAGYEQLLNGEPNYGTDTGAFGERLGAAALRGTTQTVFSDMVFAPMLHEDPRYYVKGPQYSTVNRGLYAITRPFVTRKDDGSTSVNGSLLLGYAAAAALTPAYYPQNNRNIRDTAAVYGGSLGGAALGFFLTEFSQDVLRSLHLSHAP